MVEILCPECGHPPRRTKTRYGARLSCCNLWSWGDYPLVDAATHEARKRAHAAFDGLWRSGVMGRDTAYRLLSERLGICEERCHMKLMDRLTAERVPDLIVPLLRDYLAIRASARHGDGG